jgi:hypothetical protein
MTLSSTKQAAAICAAIFCAFITIGTSVAPAVAPMAPYLA